MISTITAQCRSKGMITNPVVSAVWKQRYTPQKQNSGYHVIYLDDYEIQRRMNKQSGGKGYIVLHAVCPACRSDTFGTVLPFSIRQNILTMNASISPFI
jgi:hypothetical protein